MDLGSIKDAQIGVAGKKDLLMAPDSSETLEKATPKRSKKTQALAAQSVSDDELDRLLSLFNAARNQIQQRRLKKVPFVRAQIDAMRDSVLSFVELSKNELKQLRRDESKKRVKGQDEQWFALEFVNDMGEQHGRTEYVKGVETLALLTGSTIGSIHVAMSRWENYNHPFARRLQPMANPPSDMYRAQLYPCLIFKVNNPPGPNEFVRTMNPRSWVTKLDPDGSKSFAKGMYKCPQVEGLKKSHRGDVQLYIRNNFNL